MRRFSTVICAPVYGRRDGLATQVDIGPGEGLKHESTIHCDEFVSLPKSRLTDFIGSLSVARQRALDLALGVALAAAAVGEAVEQGPTQPSGSIASGRWVKARPPGP